MTLPKNFQFSQGSLQAYVDCPRLFQLRYIQQLSWPAPEVEPAMENERHIQQGSDFHRLAQQYFLGIPEERLTILADRNAGLARWWRNFLEDGPKLSGYTHHSEVSLSSGIGEHRLVAKYDLVAVLTPTSPPPESRIAIYDWKTSQKLPKREWQEKKLQTRVYPYLLIKAGAHLNRGESIAPDQVEMVYWFSNFPTAPMKFVYGPDQFEADEDYLSGLIAEIKTLGDEEAPKTENEKRCQFCVYRSLCNRGVKAGLLDDFDDETEGGDDFDFNLDFEQIAEIEF